MVGIGLFLLYKCNEMNVQQRIDILEKLGNYILSEEAGWAAAKEKASRENNWFIPEFIDTSSRSMATQYLSRLVLEEVCRSYALPDQPQQVRTVGIVMAGNIPMVGFHDFVTAWLSGHRQKIKLSSKDAVLIRHLAEKIIEWAPEAAGQIEFADMLKGCDAYIATGSNQSALHFEQYFGRYPHLIRRNRTGLAVLQGNESRAELEALADDVHLYFGLGCRNVTKLYVPQGYDFVPLLEAFRKYSWLGDHHKFKNNYDYQLAVLIINNKYYMTNGTILLYEEPSFFAPISQVNYEYYTDATALPAQLAGHPDIQCITGKGYLPFGQAQQPGFTDYADGADTLQFLRDC